MDALQLAGGAMVAGSWKVVAVVLAVLLLVVGTGAGTGWWLAAAARDQAQASLKAEQGVSAALRTSIGFQNAAVESMQRATAQAQARGDTAQAAAAIAGRRYEAAQVKLAGARAATCDEAMPYVNQRWRMFDETTNRTTNYSKTYSAGGRRTARRLRHRSAADADRRGAGAHAMREGYAGAACVRVRQAAAGCAGR